VPELLKRRKPKTYEYPEIPDRVPPPETLPTATLPTQQPATVGQSSTISFTHKAALAVQPTPEVQLVDLQAASGLGEYSPWQVSLDQTAVVSGMIYAEILQPPRALRPLRPRGGRK